jgi:hypothetical protein
MRVIGHVGSVTRNGCCREPTEIHCYATLCSGESWDWKSGSWVSRGLKSGMTLLAITSCNLADRQRRPEKGLILLPESWDKIWSCVPWDTITRMTVLAKANSIFPEQYSRSLLLIVTSFSRRRGDPISKVLKWIKILSWVPAGPDTKNNCAGEAQQQVSVLHGRSKISDQTPPVVEEAAPFEST